MTQEVRTQAPDLKGFLNRNVGSIQSVATRTITPDRMVKLVCAAASRQPELAQCSPLSILRAMIQSAELGLEVCSGTNEAYLVPFYNNKTSLKEAQFIPGYQGLVKLAIESAKVRNIEARVVYENDVFEYEFGLKPNIVHKPAIKNRGEVVAFYAVAYLPDGSTQFDVMSKEDVDAIRARSKAGNTGPWKTDYNEMGKKTVVRRLYKMLPKSKAMADALEIQAKVEAGDYVDGEVVRPGDANVPELAEKTINEDGEAEYTWTDEEREECKALVGVYSDSLLNDNVPVAEIDELAAEYRLKIGVPDLSPEKWANRYAGAMGRAVAKAKKT